MTLAELFSAHFGQRESGLAEDLAATGFDSLVVSSGVPFTYFADDMDAPHHSVPHFRHWCPLEGPHHLLVLEPGKKARLIRYAPEDFWYESAPPVGAFWGDHFEVGQAGTVDAVWNALGTSSRAAYIGDASDRANEAGLEPASGELLARLSWRRAIKSAYEVHCLEEATRKAARGHAAAKQVFLAGGSDLAIHHAFVQGAGQTDDQLPYPTIVALDDKAAVLHYHGKRGTRNGKVLLIDAGAGSRGYGSDITRTHTVPGCDERFVALRDGVEALQQRLCAAVKPGIPFGDLHEDTHRAIGALLVEQGIVSGSTDEVVDKGWTQAFFPHGLGHQLGIQVHDVGGHLADRTGTTAPPPERYPTLRNTRTIEEGHVFTIEPGFYFIEMLLRPLREGEDAGRFDWKTIDALTPLGGVRIEDNLLVLPGGSRNLTREHLP
jgi:Xaa-Pro dipeptidase